MIRRLDISEIDLILPLLRQIQKIHAGKMPQRFHLKATDEDFRAYLVSVLDNRNARLFAWVEQGRAIGYLLGIPHRDPSNAFHNDIAEMILDQICVDEHHRRKGIGRALIAAFEEEARADGFAIWRANHWVFNEASAALLEAAGATPSVLVRRKGL